MKMFYLLPLLILTACATHPPISQGSMAGARIGVVSTTQTGSNQSVNIKLK
jgi:hypothetical protein